MFLDFGFDFWFQDGKINEIRLIFVYLSQLIIGSEKKV